MAEDKSYAQYLLEAEQRSIANTGKPAYLPPGMKVVMRQYKGGPKPVVVGVHGLFKAEEVSSFVFGRAAQKHDQIVTEEAQKADQSGG